MTYDEALAVYHAGSEVVVKILCDLSDTIESQHVTIKALETRAAKLSKNSSNSSKRPSSDDITKPKPSKKKTEGARTIGGQPGHQRHERPLETTVNVDETGHKEYGRKLLDEVKNLFKVIHERDTMIHEDFTNALEHAKQHFITIVLNDVPSKLNKEGKEEKREAQNMAKRFRSYGDAYFEFITTPGIDPTCLYSKKNQENRLPRERLQIMYSHHLPDPPYPPVPPDDGLGGIGPTRPPGAPGFSNPKWLSVLSTEL